MFARLKRWWQSIKRKRGRKNKNRPRTERDTTMVILGKPLNSIPVEFIKDCGYIPVIVYNAAWYIEQNIQTEDIFRIQGNTARVGTILGLLNTPRTSRLADVSVHDVIEALKTFLARLPVPLLPDYVCNDLIECTQAGHDRFANILNHYRMVQPANFTVLNFIMKLFRKIIKESEHNNMTARILATVFVLDIIKPLKIDDLPNVLTHFPSEHLQRLPYLIMVVEFLINNPTLFYTTSVHALRASPPKTAFKRKTSGARRSRSCNGPLIDRRVSRSHSPGQTKGSQNSPTETCIPFESWPIMGQPNKAHLQSGQGGNVHTKWSPGTCWQKQPDCEGIGNTNHCQFQNNWKDQKTPETSPGANTFHFVKGGPGPIQKEKSPSLNKISPTGTLGQRLQIQEALMEQQMAANVGLQNCVYIHSPNLPNVVTSLRPQMKGVNEKSNEQKGKLTSRKNVATTKKKKKGKKPVSGKKKQNGTQKLESDDLLPWNNQRPDSLDESVMVRTIFHPRLPVHCEVNVENNQTTKDGEEKKVDTSSSKTTCQISNMLNDQSRSETMSISQGAPSSHKVNTGFVSPTLLPPSFPMTMDEIKEGQEIDSFVSQYLPVPKNDLKDFARIDSKLLGVKSNSKANSQEEPDRKPNVRVSERCVVELIGDPSESMPSSSAYFTVKSKTTVPSALDMTSRRSRRFTGNVESKQSSPLQFQRGGDTDSAYSHPGGSSNQRGLRVTFSQTQSGTVCPMNVYKQRLLQKVDEKSTMSVCCTWVVDFILVCITLFCTCIICYIVQNNSLPMPSLLFGEYL